MLENILSTSLIWGLSGLNILVLAVVGVLCSALVWTFTEALKVRVPSVKGTEIIRWWPLILSLSLTGIFFPPALEGVQPEHTVPVKVIAALVLVLGLIGGLGARFSNDKCHKIMDALFGAVARLIGKLGA